MKRGPPKRAANSDIAAAAAEICEVCRRLHDRDLVAAADGNVSVRLSDGRILMTPSGVNKSRLRADDLAILSAAGEVERGKPSSERGLHLAILTAVREAQAVVHAHPPTAIGWSVAHPELTELSPAALPEVLLGVGAIPMLPYARPGTDAVGASVLPHLPVRRAFVLGRHGAVCWGESLAEAYDGIERIEHVARILKVAHDLGGVTAMPPAEVAELTRIRARLGPRLL